MNTHFPTLAELRQIETAALAAGLPLMERAGHCAANLVLAWPADIKRVVILTGPGNNGGDGLVCARELQQAGLEVIVSSLSAPLPDFAAADLIVDALFGIGLGRDLEGAAKTLVEAANASGKPILAIDTPSGLDVYRGTIRGSAIRASKTLTFIADKPGLHTGAGCDYAGEVIVEALGLTLPCAAENSGELIDSPPAALRQLRRQANTHKGQFGTLAIFGGASGMLGAPLLAGRAALKLGSGKVHLGFLASDHPALDLQQPELMLHDAAGLLAARDFSHVAAGPGFGQSEFARDLLGRLLACPQPLLLDADALNLIAAYPVLRTRLCRRHTATILTPHPAEAARLLGCTTLAVQSDRIAAAQTLAQRLNSTVLLKGAGSVCSDGKRWSINRSGNAALSNAGQGDALCGIVAALLGQGQDAFEATRCAAWLHGAAADEWRKTHPACIGLTASEVIDLARDLLNRQV